MKTTIEFLDELEARLGGITDYAVAPFLGITRSAVSRYRKGKDFLGDSTAIRVAELLEIDPAVVLASVHFERAKKDAEKAVWKEIFEKLGGIAAAVVIGIALWDTAPDASAASAFFVGACNIHYAKFSTLILFLLGSFSLYPFFPRFSKLFIRSGFFSDR